MGSSGECCVPQFRHRRIAPAEFARLELPLLDLLRQLDARDRDHRVVELLESQHRPDPLLHSPMVLLHQIVQVLAGSNLDATRKFAAFFHLPHRTMRSSIGVQRDLGGHPSVLHRAAEKRFGGVYVPVPAEKEIHRLACFVDGPVQVHPLSVKPSYKSRPSSTIRPRAERSAATAFRILEGSAEPTVGSLYGSRGSPRSAIIITRSRKLSLKLVYQLTHKMTICRSK